jgi:hypothetical protein
MARPAPVISRLRIGTTGINFYSANGSVSSILTDNNGILNIVGTVTGSTGYFDAIVTTKIGERAGSVNQGYNSIAFGYNAGNDTQGGSSVSIGNSAGSIKQGSSSISIGDGAGSSNQGIQSVAIGNNAGYNIQQLQSVAVGYNAGYNNQGSNAVAIGSSAGKSQQGDNSIAIGNDAGPSGISANSIVLNASGTALYGTGPTGGFYVAPIKTTSIAGANMILGYGPDNQIVGLTGDALAQFGIGSSSTTSTDPFVKSNFIDQPPLPESINVTGSSSDIYVTYDYPKQTSYGFGLLPSISSLNILIENTGFTGTSSDFIKSTSTSSVVECINITKQGTEGLGNRNVNGTVKRMYTIRYPNLSTINTNTNFYLWYANSSLLKSMSSIYISYRNSGLPSPPTTIQGVRPSPPTLNSIPFTFKGSDKIDTADPTSSADLRFNIYYAPLSNTKRYGGLVGATGEYKNSLIGPSSSSISYNTSGNFFNVTGNTGLNYSGTITSAVYPDTTYSVDVNASNSISSGFTGISLGRDFTTQPSLPPTFVSPGSNQVTLSGLISGKAVSGGSLVTNILPPNTSSSFIQNFPIHNGTDSRGAAGPTPLVTFTSSVTGPAGAITGPSASYTGFGASYAYGTSSASNINMTLSTPTDVTGLPGYDGYYLRGNVTMGLASALTDGLVASTTPYALSVTGTYSASNSAVSVNYSAPFYYDGQQTPAITGTPSLSVIDGNTGAVCGVPVSKGPIRLRLVTNVSGLGTNFYSNGNNMLGYTPSTGTLTPSYETNLTKLSSGTISNGTFTNDTLSLSLSSSFLKLTSPSPFRITTVATNLYGAQTSGVQSNGVNILYDQASFTLANTTFTSTTALLGTFVDCYRLLSTSNPEGCYATPNNTPSNYLYNGSSYSNLNYASTKFENARNIKDDTDYNFDLIISSGLCTSNSIYYIDYSPYNGPNYSSLANSGTRYATFAWRVNTSSISLGSTAYNFINFKLGNTSSTSTLFPSDGSVYTHSSISNSKFLLYYRLEDTANLNLTGTAGWTTLTSPWIDGNAYDSSGTMYPNPGPNTTQTGSILKGLSSPFTSSSTSTTFKVKIPNPIGTNVTSSTNLYIYCRIGLNMTFPFSFSSIQASLSNA